jgi:PAS domain S-box-containing protein
MAWRQILMGQRDDEDGGGIVCGTATRPPVCRRRHLVPRVDNPVIDPIIDADGPEGIGQSRDWLAAIVQDADDAIVGTDLGGLIVSWNRGAERLLGYTRSEMIGRPITTLLTSDSRAAEQQVLTRLRRGELVGPDDLVHQHKDGSLVGVSVTRSPIRNPDGIIVGSSMIARGNDGVRRAREQHLALSSEMGHRIRNLFTLAGSLVALSARLAKSPEEVTDKVRDRLDALARAHDLTLPARADTADRPDNRATLYALIRTIVAPYAEHGDMARLTITGADVPIRGSAVTAFALLVHEFATNAAKFGAFSSPAGCVNVSCQIDDGELRFIWKEVGGPRLDGRLRSEGFGTLLGDATAKRHLGGTIARDWNQEGLTITLVVSLNQLIT